LSVSQSERIAFYGVSKVLGLLLVLPDTNATSERPFSPLKWVKMYLRTTRAYERGHNMDIFSGPGFCWARCQAKFLTSRHMRICTD